MKIIVAGSRDIDDFEVVESAIMQSGWISRETEIVSGMARGVDTLAVEFAERYHLKVHKFPADWSRHGKAAGIIRNAEMAKFADALIAVWDGKSRGTLNMIDTAKICRLQVFIFRVNVEKE